MRIKIFSAPQLHEALAKVRQDMGPEALILDRQKVRDEQGDMIWHVHAALDNHSLQQAAESAPARRAEAKQSIPKHSRWEQPQQKQHVAEPALSEPRLSGQHVSSPAQQPKNTDAALARLERIVEGLGQTGSVNLRQALGNSAEQDAFDHLLKLGVSASHAFDMAADFSQKNPLGSKSIAWANRVKPLKERNALLFSGPSGSGKSTLVAKLAAHYSMKGVRVALLSTDTERMGGLDSLRAYANTLGIPFHAIKKAADVDQIFTQLQTAQLLLIDTEGWSPQRDANLKRQTGIWNAISDAMPSDVLQRRFLMLPANMDEEDGMQQLKHAMTSNMTDIAFSKLDETQKPGKIVNWSLASALPMSYCSFGPEVPEQMGWLNAQALTTLLSKQYRETTA
ncbi:MAG: GTP-binding protein [Mariprofundus sp.]|nr:GTP-binding protein [Mariprofundus sp.]